MAESDGTYDTTYLTDGVHWTTAGILIGFPYFVTAVESALAGPVTATLGATSAAAAASFQAAQAGPVTATLAAIAAAATASFAASIPVPPLPFPLVAAGLDSLIQVPAGGDLMIAFTLADGDGDPVLDQLTDADTFVAAIWPGGGQPTVCAASASWVDPSVATATFTLEASDSAGVEPATYRFRLSLVHAGRTFSVHQGSIEFLDDPGSEDALPVYTTYARCLELAPWIAGVFDPKRHTAGYLRERATARKTFDQIVLKMYRSPTIGMFGSHSQSAFAWAGSGTRRSPLPSTLLTQWLAQDLLLVTDQVDRINAWLAIAEIGRQQIGSNNTFAAQGQACAEWASAEISACTAQIDLNNDGIGEIPIPLFAANPLFT
jgi:hypothetical protein